VAVRFLDPYQADPQCALQEQRDGTFHRRDRKSGRGWRNFRNGRAVGDYDNDGWPDIFVTSYGRCILYKNNRNGTFTDVTEESRPRYPGWTTSAVWFDFDNDGLLDLFICSFVDYGAKQKLAAATTSSATTITAFLEFSAGPPVFSTQQRRWHVH